jgi:hypothetical protein
MCKQPVERELHVSIQLDAVGDRAENRIMTNVLARTAAVVLCVGLLAPAGEAQSLGDVARQEQERRKTVPKTGKVYTNDNLRPAPMPTPAAPSSAAAPASPAAPEKPPAAAPAAPAADTATKDESYWKGRLQVERDALERAKVLLDALQSRVNGLQTDFTNRDDPASRSVIANERQRALQEIDRTRLEVANRTKAIAGIQEEARRAGVPAAWYR